MPTNININLTTTVEGDDDQVQEGDAKRNIPRQQLNSPWRSPYDVGICTKRANARSGLLPGLGEFRPYRYAPNPKNNFETSSYGVQPFLNWTDDPIEVFDEVHLHYLDRARIWSTGDPGNAPKVRNCLKGVPTANIAPGDGGTFTRLVCLWGDPPRTGTVEVFNCTEDTLTTDNAYEACFNCECKYEVTNCCPLGQADCPNCRYKCADNYDIVLPTFAEECMACLSGVVLPLSWTSDCLYNDNGGVIADACTAPDWDMVDSNPCRCGPTPVQASDPCLLSPDLQEQYGDDCQNCVGDNTILCIYCKTNCYHGLRQVNGFMDCDFNEWTLNISGGSPGVCPNRSWAAGNAVTYTANGNCPPREMLMDFLVTDDCTQSSLLQCSVNSFQAVVQIVPRNN